MGAKRRRLQTTPGVDSVQADEKEHLKVTGSWTWLFWEWHLPPAVWLPASAAVLAAFVYMLRGRPMPQPHPLHNNPFNTSSTSQKITDVEDATGHTFAYYDWKPGTPAKIDDPVDDTGYPYHILSSVRPRPLRTRDRDFAPLELRHRKRTNSTVRAFIVDDLLSDAECDVMRLAHDRHIDAMSTHDPIICFDGPETLKFHLRDLGQNIKVLPSTFTPGTRCVNASFSRQLKEWGLSWSHGTGFYLGESGFATELAERFEQVLALSQENGGALRVVSYTTNSGYKEHTDCTLNGFRGIEDRFATVLVYLDDVDVGGHTYFPELGISVKPKKGRALVWNNMSPAGKCDPTSLHAAQPVIKGTKYILQRWYYYQNFPGVDKRPPIPPIPARHTTQAMVSCDEYKHGSCRWYSTWTYDILTSY